VKHLVANEGERIGLHTDPEGGRDAVRRRARRWAHRRRGPLELNVVGVTLAGAAGNLIGSLGVYT
jgi:hypothetical protein